MGVDSKRGDGMKLLNNVRRCRFDAREMSQQELADRVGVTRMTIYSIEKGRYVPFGGPGVKDRAGLWKTGGGDLFPAGRGRR